jgi:hypothetical protein
VVDTNDEFEGETVPSDPDREATFAEMVAAAAREIAVEREESRPFGVVDENYWHDEPAIGAKRRGEGQLPDGRNEDQVQRQEGADHRRVRADGERRLQAARSRSSCRTTRR